MILKVDEVAGEGAPGPTDLVPGEVATDSGCLVKHGLVDEDVGRRTSKCADRLKLKIDQHQVADL